MPDPMEAACAALARGDVPAAAAWVRSAPTLADLVARDPAAARAEVERVWEHHKETAILLLLGRIDPAAARARYEQAGERFLPYARPAAALLWSPEEAAKLVLEFAGNHPPHIRALDAFRLWAATAWTPCPLARLRDLAAIAGDDILSRHVSAHVWRGRELPPDDIAQALTWSRHAHWCLDWIHVEGHRASDRVRRLLAAAPERHAAVLRSAAGAWLDEIPADPDVVLRRALRSGRPWEPAAASPDLVASFIHQRWRTDLESCRRAIPFLTGHDRVHYLADVIALESFAPDAADEVVSAIKDLIVMWLTYQALVPRLSDARWSRVTGKLTPYAACQYFRRLCASGDGSSPRAKQLASMAVLEYYARGQCLAALACVDLQAARALMANLSDEERDRMDSCVDDGAQRGVDMESHVRLIETAVGRGVDPKHLYALLLPYPDLPDHLGIRAFEAMSRAEPAALRAAAPFFSLAFERVDRWHTGLRVQGPGKLKELSNIY